MDSKIPKEKLATEYLANERTFLAWIRTSIAIISLGFVVAKFSVWMRELVMRLAPGTPVASLGVSMPVGIFMMAFGGLLVLGAGWHFHAVNLAIERGNVQASRTIVVTVALAVVLIAISMIVYMLMTAHSVQA